MKKFINAEPQKNGGQTDAQDEVGVLRRVDHSV